MMELDHADALAGAEELEGQGAATTGALSWPRLLTDAKTRTELVERAPRHGTDSARHVASRAARPGENAPEGGPCDELVQVALPGRGSPRRGDRQRFQRHGLYGAGETAPDGETPTYAPWWTKGPFDVGHIRPGWYGYCGGLPQGLYQGFLPW